MKYILWPSPTTPLCSEVGDCGFSRPEYVPYIGRTGLLSPGISPPLLNLVLPTFAFSNTYPCWNYKIYLIIIDIINIFKNYLEVLAGNTFLFYSFAQSGNPLKFFVFRT